MGWTLGAAIGAFIGGDVSRGEEGNRYELVVEIVGDGSFLFGVPSSVFGRYNKVRVDHFLRVPEVSLALIAIPDYRAQQRRVGGSSALVGLQIYFTRIIWLPSPRMSMLGIHLLDMAAEPLGINSLDFGPSRICGCLCGMDSGRAGRRDRQQKFDAANLRNCEIVVEE